MRHPDNEMLLAHVDGELDGVSGASVTRHLEACEGCRTRREELATTTASLASALATLDATEPAHWRSDGRASMATAASPSFDGRAAGDSPVVLPLQRRRGQGPRHFMRWAAGLVLLTGAAAAASILGVPSPFGGSASGPAATAPDPTAATAAGGAALAAAPADGVLVVELLNVATGTHVEVSLHDGAEVRVELASETSARFDAEPGRVRLDMRGVADTIRVGYPYGIVRGSVEVEGALLARVASGTVSLQGPVRGVSAAVR